MDAHLHLARIFVYRNFHVVYFSERHDQCRERIRQRGCGLLQHESTNSVSTRDNDYHRHSTAHAPNTEYTYDYSHRYFPDIRMYTYLVRAIKFLITFSITREILEIQNISLVLSALTNISVFNSISVRSGISIVFIHKNT